VAQFGARKDGKKALEGCDMGGSGEEQGRRRRGNEGKKAGKRDQGKLIG